MASGDRVTFVYDDVIFVPSEIMAATGVRVFGDLLSDGDRLRDTLTEMLHRAGCGNAVHLRSLRDVAEMRGRLGASGSDQRFLLLRSIPPRPLPWTSYRCSWRSSSISDSPSSSSTTRLGPPEPRCSTGNC